MRTVATEHGSSQTPLNLLQRSISQRRHLSKVTRAHVRSTIRTVKSGGLAAIQGSVEAALYVGAYAEIVRLREKLDGLDVMDKAYKPTVWSITKLAELIGKFKSRLPSKPQKQNGSGSLVQSAPRQPRKSEDVPQEADAEEA